jgi:hypothetical protein
MTEYQAKSAADRFDELVTAAGQTVKGLTASAYGGLCTRVVRKAAGVSDQGYRLD